MKRLVIILGGVALAGCGNVGPLRPPKGQSLPVRPAMAQVTPTAEELLASTPQAHPERIDELMKRSMPRKADRFDLPPPDGGAAPLPQTSEPSSSDKPILSSPQ
ncbi:MAG: hypothetical protein ABIN83_00270 [Sphingomicrobium sp.]